MAILLDKNVLNQLNQEIAEINIEEKLQKEEIIETERLLLVLRELYEVLAKKKYANNKREVEETIILTFRKIKKYVDDLSKKTVAEQKLILKKPLIIFRTLGVDNEKVNRLRQELGETRGLAAKKLQIWYRIKASWDVCMKRPHSIGTVPGAVVFGGYSGETLLDRQIPSIIKNLEVFVAYEKKEISIEEFFKHDILAVWRK